MKDIYEDFTEYLEKEEIALHWNTTESALKFLNEKELNHNQKSNNSNQQIDLTMSKKEWKYFNALRKSFTDLIEPSDWSTKNLGSFFVRHLLNQFKAKTTKDICANINSKIQSHLDKFHTVG